MSSRAVVYPLEGGALLVIPDDVPASVIFREPVALGGSSEREIEVRSRSAMTLREAVDHVTLKRDDELRRMGAGT